MAQVTNFFFLQPVLKAYSVFYTRPPGLWHTMHTCAHKHTEDKVESLISLLLIQEPAVVNRLPYIQTKTRVRQRAQEGLQNAALGRYSTLCSHDTVPSPFTIHTWVGRWPNYTNFIRVKAYTWSGLQHHFRNSTCVIWSSTDSEVSLQTQSPPTLLTMRQPCVMKKLTLRFSYVSHPYTPTGCEQEENKYGELKEDTQVSSG